MIIYSQKNFKFVVYHKLYRLKYYVDRNLKPWLKYHFNLLEMFLNEFGHVLHWQLNKTQLNQPRV